jgi:hypothetical protein
VWRPCDRQAVSFRSFLSPNVRREAEIARLPDLFAALGGNV